MIGWIRGCLTRVGCLTLLVLGAAGGWLYQEEIRAWWVATAGEAPAELPSERLAGRAEEKLYRLVGPDAEVEVRLSEVELVSLLRYRVRPLLPEGAREPSISLGDSTARVSAELDLSRLVGSRLPGMLRGMLGDSTRVEAELRPSVPSTGTLRLGVRSLRAGGAPVPAAVLPWVLEGIGVTAPPDDPGAVDVPVAAPLSDAEVRDGELRLVAVPRRRGG